MITRSRLTLFLLFVLFTGVLAAQDTVAALDGAVLRISHDNHLALLLDVKSTGPDLRYGTTDPVVSPNQRQVALIHDFNGFIHDLKSGRETAFTTAGKPGSERLLPISVFIVGFSRDGRYLYYNIAPGKNECPDCPNRHPKRQPADYGLFRYTLDSATSEKLSAPGSIRLFKVLDGDRMFGTSVGDYGDQIGVFKLPDFSFTAFPKECAAAFDCAMTERGRRAVCLQIKSARPQLVSCEVAQEKSEPVTDIGQCTAQFGREQLSPDEKHVSYLEVPGCKGSPSLVIDKKTVFQCSSFSDYRWLDNTRLLTHCADDVSLIDLSGKKLGSVKLAPTPHKAED